MTFGKFSNISVVDARGGQHPLDTMSTEEMTPKLSGQRLPLHTKHTLTLSETSLHHNMMQISTGVVFEKYQSQAFVSLLSLWVAL